MQSIIYETSRPAKTFTTNTYLFFGIVLCSIGIYYFTTQLNWNRPEEYIPLGAILTIGLYFLLGYQGNWPIPSSKGYTEKLEYSINSETNNLECTRTFQKHPPHRFILCSLDGVQSFDYTVESRTTTTRTGGVEQGYGAGLGDTSPTGLAYRYQNVTSSNHTNFIILLPSNKKVQVSSSISNISDFAMKLKELLAMQNSPTSPQSL